MEVNHTPGPWKTHGAMLGHKGDIFSPTAKSIRDCHHIARCFAPRPAKTPLDDLHLIVATNDAVKIIEANARLIAAAPDLLDALKALRIQALQSTVNSPANEWGSEALGLANAAIRKAEGRT